MLLQYFFHCFIILILNITKAKSDNNQSATLAPKARSIFQISFKFAFKIIIPNVNDCQKNGTSPGSYRIRKKITFLLHFSWNCHQIVRWWQFKPKRRTRYELQKWALEIRVKDHGSKLTRKLASGRLTRVQPSATKWKSRNTVPLH